MPQMAPYNWLLLNMMFTFIMIFYITYIYYYYYKINIKENNYSSKIYLNLKW